MEINVFMSPKSNPPFNITSREWDCVGWSAHLNSYIYTYKNIFGLFPFCSNIKWFRGNNWYKFYYISKHFFWIRFAQKIKLFLDWTFVVGNLSSNKFTVFSLCFCPRFHHELQWRSVDCLWSKWDGVNFCHVSFRVHVAGQKFPGPGRPHNHNALFFKKNKQNNIVAIDAFVCPVGGGHWHADVVHPGFGRAEKHSGACGAYPCCGGCHRPGHLHVNVWELRRCNQSGSWPGTAPLYADCRLGHGGLHVSSCTTQSVAPDRKSAPL